jgi:hypothetical protein
MAYAWWVDRTRPRWPYGQIILSSRPWRASPSVPVLFHPMVRLASLKLSIRNFIRALKQQPAFFYASLLR